MMSEDRRRRLMGDMGREVRNTEKVDGESVNMGDMLSKTSVPFNPLWVHLPCQIQIPHKCNKHKGQYAIYPILMFFNHTTCM